MSRVLLIFVVFSWSAVAYGQDSATDEGDLAKQVGKILRRNCYRCHKGQGSESGYAFNVLDISSLLDESMIVDGDHEGSEIYNAMFRGRMPPRNRPQLPRPSAEDVQIVKQWIDSGAQEIPKPTPRPTITLKDELLTIRADLRARPRDDRFNIRYLTLTHLHNDPIVDQEQLDATRLALVKTLNSLSWESLLVPPEAIDEARTVYAVDIVKLGWNREHWNALSQAYPYALSFGSFEDVDLKEIDEDIRDLRASDRTPVSLRADWLISVGTKPPLYYKLVYDLELPELLERRAATDDAANPKRMTDVDLEQYLGVDVIDNIVRGNVWRSGFTESGISGQNRLVERHAMKSGGFYWKSYDFKSSNRTAILSEFPLGPSFDGNQFRELAFIHDGGEIIFSLPNGLQAYLLVDARGNRIEAGPIEVVADSLRTSGNEQIVSGLSCIACHRGGMIEPPDDEVRRFSGVVGSARDHVRRIYPEDKEFRRLLEKDRKLFARSLAEATRDFVAEGNIKSLPEPVGEVARHYHLEPMRIETVAADLYISVDRLRGAIEADPRLRQLGLRVLLRDGGTIKRAAWESPATFPLMRQVARQFGYDPR
ncbi:MAG: hypothetical protein ACI9HK_001923 [Pirellulaceae bacterium]|jgi:hypothetical protein